MARARYAVIRTPRAVGDTVQRQMTELWDARLSITQAPEIGGLMFETANDPLSQAGTMAMGLHEHLEAPSYRARQSRDHLRRMADLALRKAE